MSASKTRVEFFMRKLKWLDAVGRAAGKDHFTAHVAMIVGYHMNSDTGDTFVGRETIADLIVGHVRTVELSIQKLEALGFLRVERARGRGRVNTYTMAFPEKAVSTPPIETEKAVPRPPINTGEKAVPADLKGGETPPKTRSPHRPNLKDTNLEEITLGEIDVSGGVVAAPASPPRPVQTAPPRTARRMTDQDRPKSFKTRGQFEQHIAELISEAGGDGWDVLMGLDEVRVAALCRRLKNGVLTQQEIAELCAPRRQVSAR
jgi:hypothetical protein